jgi:hypothetical protein
VRRGVVAKTAAQRGRRLEPQRKWDPSRLALSEQSEIALAAPSPVLTFGHQDGNALSAARLQAAATTPNRTSWFRTKRTSDNAR